MQMRKNIKSPYATNGTERDCCLRFFMHVLYDCIEPGDALYLRK